MAELLQQLKAEVRPLSDSQEASGLIQQEKFDGIFLDLKMPILSGFDLANWPASPPAIRRRHS